MSCKPTGVSDDRLSHIAPGVVMFGHGLGTISNLRMDATSANLGLPVASSPWYKSRTEGWGGWLSTLPCRGQPALGSVRPAEKSVGVAGNRRRQCGARHPSHATRQYSAEFEDVLGPTTRCRHKKGLTAPMTVTTRFFSETSMVITWRLRAVTKLEP